MTWPARASPRPPTARWPGGRLASLPAAWTCPATCSPSCAWPPPTSARSVVPRKRRPVRRPFLDESVPAFFGFVRSIGKPGGLTGEQLLSDQAVVDEVKGVL